ncbi:hypothetical protein GCM10010329_58340 [Streptomyces spiroverticillatus]|uniref:Right handed beta helix domain-containing protein n=1 Tax=Streptomyces finlayi TaxID=67296 RepID=A0A919CDR0_9ACTN|nr:hypothetical protein GCM10010329_58340 [Streptomyces spiroverticillatus]GHD08567.1 hypothetical protein GCM10010334_62000 [Streptomyces finlayi]
MALGSAALTGCAGPHGTARPGPTGGPAELRVPAAYPTIQEAVDVARSGDLVLVAPGVYKEEVQLRRPGVVLRGESRDKVVVDGQFTRFNGITVTGAGSVVENLTVRNHLANGVLFTGVTDRELQRAGAGGSGYDPLDTAKFPALGGFRASYVTAHNNALYGIYAFDARDGVIEHSYGSGHSDSGIYVGQCDPCNTVVRHNTVEHNAIGIEVTNASTHLAFVANTVRANRVGITVNSNNLEALGPQHDAAVVGNTVTGNNDAASPEQADGGFGVGIGIGGGTRNLVARNLLRDHRVAALRLQDVQGYPVRGNTLKDNAVDARTPAGLLLEAARTGGNCYEGNGSTRSLPAALPPEVTRCPGRDTALAGGRPRLPSAEVPPGISFREVAAPGPQPQLPGGARAAVRPAHGLPGAVDLNAYRLPAGG